MRPLRLELEGFTVYRHRTVLDLEDLDLFAITGPTGAGKSSLLDAMTYALYGAVARIGAHGLSQLISQGQPKMSVLLTFQVDRDRYRVLRQTPRGKPTSVRLEREVGGTWESFGEGADRVREVNEQVRRLVGLDYDAFTRSVLLPQGRFAEFLVGDSKQRREILTDLLGLELFSRMQVRANEIAKESAARAEQNRSHVARTLADVDEPAVKAAERDAHDATARAAALAAAEAEVEELSRQGRQLSDQVVAVQRLEQRARTVAREAGRVAEELARVEPDVAAARDGAEVAAREAAASRDVAARATDALRAAESQLGDAEKLARAAAELAETERVATRLKASTHDLAEAQRTLAELESGVETARADLELAREEHAAAAAAFEGARAALEEALHRDRVAAVVAGLEVGDPCPVCGEPLTELPAVDARALAAARKAEAVAKGASEKAATAERSAQRAADRVDSEVVAARRELARREEARSSCAHEHDERLQELSAFFGGDLPLDPAEEIRLRQTRLRGLRDGVERSRAAAEAAERAAQRAADALRDAERRCGDLTSRLRALPTADLVEDARRCLPNLVAPAALTSALPTEAREAVAVAREWADAVTAIADAAAERAAAVGGELDVLAEKAVAAVPADLRPGGQVELERVAALVREAARSAVVAEATAASHAARMAEALEERRMLEAEADRLSADAALYRALGSDLGAGKLIEFLQGEALRLLAAAGSERLLFLSQGRYTLVAQGEEFFVEDRQNADERRSVKTLSGGETFLASLALALALSEHIQSLAVSERAKLDSLFIDEGFGALDPENLQIASDAIEQLGGEGRMVGVITHVWELAERLPSRIEVRRLPDGGSTLAVVA